MSGGTSSSQMQFADELCHTRKEERRLLLQAAGFGNENEISPGAGLALKADLQIPWNKLRHLQRYSSKF